MDKPVYWIDVGPSTAPTPGAVVQWFSFALLEIPSPELSSNVVASSPSHISDSFSSRGDDSPPSVPGSVPEGGSEGSGGGFEDGSIESGRATRQNGSAIWRFPDGYRHPRNIYNDSVDTTSFVASVRRDRRA